MSIKFVFFGTDDFSVMILEELKRAGFLPALLVSAPDRPKDRGLMLTPPPVKIWAQENKIKSLQPEKLDKEFATILQSMIVDCFTVASYGKIIPKEILDIPKKGTLNVHPSLLPKYRGAAPIENQILNDEKEIGVTIMLMDEQMDHGPILARRELEIRNPKSEIRNKSQNTNIQIPNGTKLRKKLAEEGGKLLAEVMPKWIAGEIKPTPQDHSQATYTKKLTKADGEINLNDDPYKNFLKIRAFEDSIGTSFFVSLNSPFPSAKGGSASGGKGSTRRGRDFKSSVLGDSDTSFRKGGIKQTRVLITSAEFRDGKLLITRVIPEGKKEMSYEEFLRGFCNGKK